jgi:signal transduction histidine kinase/CheY-like chemotaxis protein
MNPWRSGAMRYGVALLVIVLATVVRWALQPVMGAVPPYITFYLAIVAAAAFGGCGPGLLATAAGLVLGIVVAAENGGPLELGGAAEQVRLALYALSGVGISLIAAAMHRARDAAEGEAQRLRGVSEELRQANARLLEADQSRNDFLAVLSHELRNPLMPIKHSLYILERAGGESANARRARAVIGRQLNQLTRLVNDLLDVTRISRDKLHLLHERFDLRETVRRTLEDHRTVFESRALRVHDRLLSEPLWVDGDPSRIAQALGNLLHNAAKFTPGGCEVFVTLERRGPQAVLTVRDSGIGMTADLLARVFEPFAQAEQRLDRAAGGLGLGLTLVKRLVEMHGGTVDAYSAGVGQGSTLTVALPANAQPAPAPTAAPASLGGERRRVLVVDDNVDSADSLSELLQTCGHDVDVCYRGEHALMRARQFAPDTVLCDIGLPGMDGYDVARAIRDDPALRSARLVALTGYASPQDRDKAFAAGFDKHLVKPPSLEQLELALV